jgi:hypothetical protein
MSEKKSLVAKLSEVMKEVKYIEKKGYNSFHKYKYATESDVAEKVRESLAERNVIMIPNMVSHDVREHTNAKGKTEYIVTVNMEFKFMDGDNGQEITFNMYGEGQDAGDKAVYKAITGAQKYALMKAFMIPTGDDPEADNGTDERNAGNTNSQSIQKDEAISSKQVGLVKSLVKELAIHGKVEDSVIINSLNVKLKTNIKDVTQLTKRQASRSIEILNAWKEEKINKGA